jgi:hypothetical protein
MKSMMKSDASMAQLIGTSLLAQRRTAGSMMLARHCKAGFLAVLIASTHVAMAVASDPRPLMISAVGAVTDLRVTQVGQGPREEGCEKFKPSDEDVRAVLSRAVLISRRAEHDSFSTGPCFASGTFEGAFETWQWKLRDMGTIELRSSNDEIFLLGDPQQSIAMEEDDCARAETDCRDCGAEAP